MKRLLAIGIVFAAWAAGVPAEAMPLGMRVAMWGVAVARDRDGGLSGALDAPGLEFSTGGDAGWTAQGETAHGGSSALKSGAIGNGQVSWVETSVDGAGEVSFWWKASSERYRQYAMFSVDGQERLRIGGEQDWTNATVQVEGSGEARSPMVVRQRRRDVGRFGLRMARRSHMDADIWSCRMAG